MSYADELKAIESRFSQSWVTRTLVAYANVPFTPTVGTSYVRLTVLPGRSNQASMGSTRLYRHPGVIDIAIFTPTGEAAKSAIDLADLAAAIFRGASFSGITCRAPEIQNVGVRDGWFQINVSVSYYRDELF